MNSDKLNLITSVFSIAKDFMENPKYVELSNENIEKTAELMKKEGKIDFLSKEKEESLPTEDEGYNFEDEIKLELLASSINYCYWYGKSDIRPGGACSTLMYVLLVNEYNQNNRQIDVDLINNLVKKLTEYRFTLLEDRMVHLEEAFYFGIIFAKRLLLMKNNLHAMFNELVLGLPGFASDLFLKRACLFFMQLNRKFDWFSDSIGDLPVPADYHLPQMLRYFNCISYSSELGTIINENELIPKGSLMECEIRSATIMTCRKLAFLTGWTNTEIDTWFFTKRKECNDPFHLTITTDY